MLDGLSVHRKHADFTSNSSSIVSQSITWTLIDVNTKEKNLVKIETWLHFEWYFEVP